MIAALWILTALGLALWSLFAWALHGLLTLDPRRLDEVNVLAASLPHGEWLERWLPGWRALLRLGVESTQVVLGWVGEVAPWVVWTVWGAGTLCLLAGAGLVALAVKAATPLPAAPAQPSRR